MSNHNLSVNDEDEDALFERIKEESLKHYNEVELARTNKESGKNNKKENVANKELSICEESQPISKQMWYEGSEAQGFYLSAGSTYIYPTNYPVREYQENIVRTALFKNTLVSLPTGLGKTFIAAVVMYNYYRWYPKGKIVFMAPTRPLVAQQIKACYNIMGLPIEDTTEMTGNLNVLDRVSLWKEKRVFFLTPQVMVNDIRSKSCPAKLIKCLVVDEAHRAVKDYAYCHVVSLLDEEQAVYRTLALSATPGNDVNGVQQIIQNLKISSLEFRGEDALDVVKYTHQKNVQSVVVNLSINIQRVKGDYLHIYDKYAKRLRECKAMNCNISTVTKFQVLKASEKFRAHPPRGLPPTAVGSIICDFSVCMSLAHALELLQIYGLRAFYSYLSEGGDKNKAAATRLRNDEDLKKILGRLQQMLSKKPGEEGYIWGHPKLFKLTSVLIDHFKAAKEVGEKTKAIIFCQYRVVVTEVMEVLASLDSDIKPIMFIGQSSNSKDKGMTQAKQLEIMKNFRLGVYNCMIATCVAEEGLDIGEVDLIVLMEAHKSPIRLVQRIGRTGRKRNGKCVVLVTEGREEYKFQEAMAARKSYVSSVLNAKSVREKLCPNCPSMIPQGIKPTRQLLHIEVIEQVSPEKPTTSKQVDIRACLVPEQSPYITSEEYKNVVQEIGKKSLSFDQIPESNFLFHRMNKESMPIDELLKKDFTVFSEWNDWNLQLHEIHELSHSSESELMCGLLNRFYTFDVKFFNISTIKEKEGKKRKRDDGKMDVDTDEELITTKKGRKTKKEVDKVKFGMDIRHCLAAAKDRLRTHKEFDPNEIIDLDSPNYSENNRAENNDKLVDEVILSLEKELNLKDLTTTDSLKLNTPFQEITSKTIDSFSIQAKKKESNMFTILTNLSSNKETLMTSLLSELESLKLESVVNDPEKEIQEILHPDIFWDNESLASQKASRKSPDSLVGLDDLLDEGKETGDTSQKSDNHCHTTYPNDREASLGAQVNKHLNVKTDAERPITPLPKDSEQFWESLPEEFIDFKPSSTPNRCKYLAASTPINNKFINSVKKASHIKQFSNEIESPILKTKNEDVWNIDDLFDDDEDFNLKILDNHKASQNSHDSTMIGITQMVSLIEQEKLANKQNNSCNENIIIPQPGQSKIDNDIPTENYQKEKSKEECDKLLLDEDDDFFTSIPNIDLTPVKNLPAKNVSHDLKNFSSDMFASTMFQSRILEKDRTNDQIRVDEEEPCVSPKLKHFDNVDKINNLSKISEDNFITDINDILENDEDSDDLIIISDDERENECLASQRVFLEFEASKNQKPAEDNSLDDVMTNADFKESDSLSFENPQQQHQSQRSHEKSNNTVSITLRSTHDMQENQFIEEINLPIEESTVAQVKINPPNFKRFFSNKKKPVSSNLSSNSTIQIQSTSSIKPNNPIEVTKSQKIKCQDSNNKVIVEEDWWYDFDCPSTYPKRDEFKLDKPTNLVSNVQKKPVSIEVSKIEIESKNSNVRKITEFAIPLNKVEVEGSSKINNRSNDLNVNKKEPRFVEPKEFPIRKNDNFKLESTVNMNRNQINGFINEPWDVSDVLSLGKSCSEKNVFITDSSNKKNVSNATNSKKSFEDLSSSKEETSRKSRDTTDSFKNSHKFSSIEISDDEEVFKDPRSSSRGKSSKENSTEKRSSNKIRSSSDHKKKRRRKPGCQFIDREAEVSEDDTSSGNDDSSGLDDLDESFINDDQENYENIHAKYLQSVKSPIQGKFKIPQRLNKENINVYSQFEVNDSEYINDSFCVESDESTDENELSAIEIAERKLEKKRKQKKQNNLKPKRRRIRIVSPDQANVLDEDVSLLSDNKSTEKSENIDALKQKKKFCILSDSEGTASDSSPLLVNKKILSKNKLAQTTLKVNSKKCLNFFTALSNKNKKKVVEDDEDLQRALIESQQEYLRSKELEEKELLEAIEKSKAELGNNLPSTSGLSNK